MDVENPVELQRLTPDDWTLWRDVRLRALRESPYAFDSTLAFWSGAGDTESRWRNRLESVPLNLVALVAGEPSGQVGGSAPNDRGYVELLSLWVAPDVRGRGVGEALVDAVVRWAASQGRRDVTLSVKRSNAAAIALYERCGFAAAPPNPDTPDDEQVMDRPA